MLPLLIVLTSSRGSFDEYETLPVINGVGESVVSQEDDPPPTSPYAFVSVLTGDDELEHYYMGTLLTGYNLAAVSPEYDRVLIMPSDYPLSDTKLHSLSRVWTHIIRRSFFKWNCKFPVKEQSPSDKHHWFKLHAWGLSQYQKIFFIGHFNLILDDIGKLFYVNRPAAPPDMQIWGNSLYGPVKNMDFVVFPYSEQIYVNITKEGCDWVQEPDSHHLYMFGKWYKEKDLGAYDNGLIQSIYKGNEFTFPYYYNFEITREYSGNRHELDMRIKSYRYAFGSRPWDDSSKDEFLSQVYVDCLQTAFDGLQMNLELSRYSLTQPSDDNADYVSMRWRPYTRTPNYKVYEFYEDFANPLPSILRSKCIALALSSCLIVMFKLSTLSEPKTVEQAEFE